MELTRNDEVKLGGLGDEGWELVAVTAQSLSSVSVAYLKRNKFSLNYADTVSSRAEDLNSILFIWMLGEAVVLFHIVGKIQHLLIVLFHILGSAEYEKSLRVEKAPVLLAEIDAVLTYML